MRRLRPLLLCAALLATALPGSAAAFGAADGGSGGGSGSGRAGTAGHSGTQQPRALDQVIPAPASVTPSGDAFTIDEDTPIRVSGSVDVRRVGEQLAALLRPSTGYELPVTRRPGTDGIQLKLVDELRGKAGESRAAGPVGPSDMSDVSDVSGASDASGTAERDRQTEGAHGKAEGAREKAEGKDGERGLGAEGYRLAVTTESVEISATTRAGLLNGVQTLRQLLPDRVESRSTQPGPWQVAGGTIVDEPRYSYRGAMLDVSRHFLGVDKVKRYIDQIALYKLNKLHLHLSDDQGWRIAIDSWPRLAEYGGSTEVGGGEGGHYTKADYREIVRYAAERNVMIVPEIDMPGHTNAALASYAELNCNGVAPPLYTGTKVGFSSLCVDKELTYDFVDDVVREIARMTPGPYLHIGGDEAHSTDQKDYTAFMDRAQRTVAKYGKTVVGWHQLTGANPAEGAIAQYWGTEADEKEVIEAAQNGTELILSPANRAYLDMKYNKDTPYGLDWAGHVEAQQSYDWDPGSYFKGVPEQAIHGVEAPLWTETIETSGQIEYMAFPRLPGIAELGWSPAETHDWGTYRERLAQQGPRWEHLGMEYWRSPQVPWPAETKDAK